jgi:GntR family transcriptional regulator, transcriptional repressor for pyruvate dehydrogenase complex
MPHLHQSAVPRQYRLVAAQIRALIDVDRIRTGTKLPPEREMAQQFGVSRQVVREALRSLEFEGQVEIRGRSGAYVSGAHKTNAAQPLLDRSPAELIQARVVLERAIITLAATRVSQPSLQRVGAALQAMREDLNRGLCPVAADRQFHLSIAEMGGCEALIGVVATLFDSFHSAIPPQRVGDDAMNGWRAALVEHEVIFQALKARDPITADAALCSHLLAARNRSRSNA